MRRGAHGAATNYITLFRRIGKESVAFRTTRPRRGHRRRFAAGTLPRRRTEAIGAGCIDMRPASSRGSVRTLSPTPQSPSTSPLRKLSTMRDQVRRAKQKRQSCCAAHDISGAQPATPNAKRADLESMPTVISRRSAYQIRLAIQTLRQPRDETRGGGPKKKGTLGHS